MKIRWGILGVAFFSLALIADGWLGCYLSDKWTFGCIVQGMVFFVGIVVSAISLDSKPNVNNF